MMNNLTDKLLKFVGRAVEPSNPLMSLADSILELVVSKNNASASGCSEWQTYQTNCSVECYDRYSYLQHSWCPWPPYDFYRTVCGGYCIIDPKN